MNKNTNMALQNLLGSARVAGERIAAEALAVDRSTNPLAELSARELQIFIAIGSGIQPAQAAKRLGIAVKSFSTYRARVLEKLKLESTAEIAILAFELKVVPSVLKRFEEKEDEHVTRDGAGSIQTP